MSIYIFGIDDWTRPYGRVKIGKTSQTVHRREVQLHNLFKMKPIQQKLTLLRVIWTFDDKSRPQDAKTVMSADRGIERWFRKVRFKDDYIAYEQFSFNPEMLTVEIPDGMISQSTLAKMRSERKAIAQIKLMDMINETSKKVLW